MGGCCSNDPAVRQREGLNEDQIRWILQKTPKLISPSVLYHLLSLDTALGGAALSDRENFQNVQINFSVIWALLLGVAAGGVLMTKPENSVFGRDFTLLGTTFCFSFLCFLVSTLHSLFFIIMTVAIGDDDEFQHWLKVLGPFSIKFPIGLGVVGILTLLYCIAENMTVEYDMSYTGICLLKCFVICLAPMVYVPYRMTWAALVTSNTAIEFEARKQCPMSAKGIHEFLVTDYLEGQLEGDVMKLDRDDFIGHFKRNTMGNGSFVLKLAGRIYDDFEANKIQEMLNSDLSPSNLH